MPIQLLVNIDHIATLRNARGEGYPVPAQAAQICEKSGAAGIVFHLRGDRRHIMDQDLPELKEAVHGILDFEMAATEEMIELLHKVQPDICTLVPEGREELTTEGGLHLSAVFKDFKTRIFPAIRNGAGGSKVEISLFVDPNPDDIERAIELGSDAIELHTGTYANASTPSVAQEELTRLAAAAKIAHSAGLKVNAGHGLNQKNLPPFLRAVPHLADISIGHALISESVFHGLANTVHAYMSIIEQVKKEQS
tara:strand:+ start:4568 stop:5323 length:756 start_codon:yes stop_codon:yes gene_type:complete